MGTHVLFARRWLVLAVGFIINFALWSVAHPFVVPSTAGRWMCQSNPIPVTQTRFLSYAWFMSAVVGAIPGLWLMKHLGLRKALTISVSCMVLGVSLRCVYAAQDVAREGDKGTGSCSNAAYWWILSGNCLAALGAVPIQACVAVLAATWFPARQFGLATTLMSLSIPAGLHSNLLIINLSERSKLLLAIDFDRELIIHVAIAALALLGVPLITSGPPLKPCITAEAAHGSEKPIEDLSTSDSSHHGIKAAQELLTSNLLIRDSGSAQGDRSVATAATTADTNASGPLVGSSTAEPSSSTSMSPQGSIAMQLKRERDRLEGPLLSEAWDVLSIPQFWQLLLAFSAGMGACLVYYLLLEEFLDSSNGASLEEAINLSVVAGSFGAIAVPASVLTCLLDCTRGHKYIVAASQTVVAVLAGVLTISIRSRGTYDNIQACLICMSVMAFLAIPIALDIASEFTFPVRSALPTAILWVGVYATAAILGILTDTALANEKSPRPRFSGAKYMLLCCFIIAAILWWLLPVRYVKRVVEETYKDSLHLSTATRDIFGTMPRQSEPSRARSWINSASGRFAVPSINRNLYIIAEEHGVSSSGGQTGGLAGGGTGSARNLSRTSGCETERAADSTATAADSLQSSGDTDSKLRPHSNPLAAAASPAGSMHDSVGDADGGLGRRLYLPPDHMAAASPQLSQVRVEAREAVQGASDGPSSKLVQQVESKHGEPQLRFQAPRSGDLKPLRPHSSSASSSHTMSCASSRTAPVSAAATTSSMTKASSDSTSSGRTASLRFVWRLPPFSYLLKRQPEADTRSSSYSSKLRGLRSSSAPVEAARASSDEPTLSHISSQSSAAPRAGSGSRGGGTGDFAGRSEGSLIRWAIGAQPDCGIGGSSITSGCITDSGVPASFASSAALANHPRKPSVAPAQCARPRARSGSESNDSVSDASAAGGPHARSSGRLDAAERSSNLDGGALSLCHLVRERSAQVARMQTHMEPLHPVHPIQSNSMVGHVSDSGDISLEFAQGLPAHHGALRPILRSVEPVPQKKVAAGGPQKDQETSVGSSGASAACVTLDDAATAGLRSQAAAQQPPAVAQQQAAAGGGAAPAAQQLDSSGGASAQAGDTLVGAGTLTEILRQADLGDPDRFAAPLSPRASQSQGASQPSNLSLSTAHTLLTGNMSPPQSGGRDAAGVHALEPSDPAQGAAGGTTDGGHGRGAANGYSATGGTSALMSLKSSHCVSTTSLGLSSTLDKHHEAAATAAEPKKSMVWWANPLGDRQSTGKADDAQAMSSTADTELMSLPTAVNDSAATAASAPPCSAPGDAAGEHTGDGQPLAAVATGAAVRRPASVSLHSNGTSVAPLAHAHADRDAGQNGSLALGATDGLLAAASASRPTARPQQPGVPTPTAHPPSPSTSRSLRYTAPPRSSSSHTSASFKHSRSGAAVRSSADEARAQHDDETPFHSPRTPRRIISPHATPSASPRAASTSQEQLAADSDHDGALSNRAGAQLAQHMNDAGTDTIADITESNTISLSPSPGDPHIAGRTVMHSIDGLLHSSMQSWQLFGSVVAPQAGTTSVVSSQLDPVSAVAVRMQHHDATSSVLQPFANVDSALLQPSHVHVGALQQLQQAAAHVPGMIAEDSITQTQNSCPSSPATLAASAQHGTISATQSVPISPRASASAPNKHAGACIGSVTEAPPSATPEQRAKHAQHCERYPPESKSPVFASLSSPEEDSHSGAQAPQPDACMASYSALEDTIAGSSFSPMPAAAAPYMHDSSSAAVPGAARSSSVERESTDAVAALRTTSGSHALFSSMLPNARQSGGAAAGRADALLSPEAFVAQERGRHAVGPAHKHSTLMNSGHSREFSMCLDTYPEAQSGRLARDRSVFSMAPSIDIQIHHHVAPTDELSQNCNSLTAEDAAHDSTPHPVSASAVQSHAVDGDTSPGRATHGAGAKQAASSIPSPAAAACAARVPRGPKSRVKSGTLAVAKSAAPQSAPKVPPRPISAPLKVTAAAAAAARFGLDQNFSPLQVLQWRTTGQQPRAQHAHNTQHAADVLHKLAASAQLLQHAQQPAQQSAHVQHDPADTTAPHTTTATVSFPCTDAAADAGPASSSPQPQPAPHSARDHSDHASRARGATRGASAAALTRPHRLPQPHASGKPRPLAPSVEVIMEGPGSCEGSASGMLQGSPSTTSTAAPAGFTAAGTGAADLPAEETSGRRSRGSSAAASGPDGMDAEMEALRELLGDEQGDTAALVLSTQRDGTPPRSPTHARTSDAQLLTFPPASAQVTGRAPRTLRDAHASSGAADMRDGPPAAMREGAAAQASRPVDGAPGEQRPGGGAGAVGSGGLPRMGLHHGHHGHCEGGGGGAADWHAPGASAGQHAHQGLEVGGLGAAFRSTHGAEQGGLAVSAEAPAPDRRFPGLQVLGNVLEGGRRSGEGGMHEVHGDGGGPTGGGSGGAAEGVVGGAGISAAEGGGQLPLRDRFAMHLKLSRQNRAQERQAAHSIHAVDSASARAGASVRGSSLASSMRAAGGAVTGRKSLQAAAAVAVAQAQERARQQGAQPPLKGPLPGAHAGPAPGLLQQPQQYVLMGQQASAQQPLRHHLQAPPPEHPQRRLLSPQPEPQYQQAFEGRQAASGTRPWQAPLTAPPMQGARAHSGPLTAVLQGLQLADVGGAVTELDSAAADRSATHSSAPDTFTSRLYSLPGAGDSVIANDSPDHLESGGSCWSDRSGEITGKAFGSEFGSAGISASIRYRLNPSSGASQGKPHPLAKVHQG